MALAKRVAQLYRKLHPEDNLRIIPGMGEHTALVFLAAVGDLGSFHNQSGFANWNAVVPGDRNLIWEIRVIFFISTPIAFCELTS